MAAKSQAKLARAPSIYGVARGGCALQLGFILLLVQSILVHGHK